MKKGILILILAIFSISSMVNGQEKADALDSVYVASGTAYLTPTYDFYFDGVDYYDGVVGFIGNISSYVDTLSGLYFEGGYLTGPFVVIDSLILTNVTQYNFNQANPIYHKYRLRAVTISGDTASLKNNIFFYKKSKK